MNDKRYSIRWKIFGWRLDFSFPSWNKKKLNKIQEHEKQYKKI